MAWIQPDSFGCLQDFLFSENEIRWVCFEIFAMTTFKIWGDKKSSYLEWDLSGKILGWHSPIKIRMKYEPTMNFSILSFLDSNFSKPNYAIISQKNATNICSCWMSLRSLKWFLCIFKSTIGGFFPERAICFCMLPAVNNDVLNLVIKNQAMS